jgi:hypothetical protein
LQKSDEVHNAASRSTDGETEEEWKPRLLIVLHEGSSTRFETVREPYRDEPDGFGVKPQVKYRERRVAIQSPVKTGVLYCDVVSINVAKNEDNRNFTLECADNIHLRVNGLLVDAESASFKDGKCELVNAKLAHDGTIVTSEKLTLTLPVHGVSMNSFGRLIPAEAKTERSVPTPTEDPLSRDDADSSLPEVPSGSVEFAPTIVPTF